MKNRMLNGYVVIYEPTHSKAMTSENWSGYVYEHIKLAEISIGRPLRLNEDVHHLDFNRMNNRPENLLVLEDTQHTKLHNWLRNGATGLKDLDVNRVNSGKSKEVYCCTCGTPLTTGQSLYCSRSCAGKNPVRHKVDHPTKEVLADDLTKMSWVALGKKYGVSDNAVRKWARQYGLL